MLTAPSPLPAATLPASPPIERVIGEVTAALACSIAARLGELAQHRVQEGTLQQGGELLAQLYALWRATCHELKFDRVALVYGRQVLQEHRSTLAAGGVDDDAAIADLIAGAIDLLHKVARARMN